MKSKQVHRYVSEFSDKDDSLIATYELSEFELEAFQSEFDVEDSENSMVDCFPILQRNVQFINRYLQQEPEWNFSNYSYFLEANAV